MYFNTVINKSILHLGCQVHGGKDGIHFTFVRDGRPSGEAYIELETEQDLNNALTKDKHHMGKRYIEGEEINACPYSTFS